MNRKIRRIAFHEVITDDGIISPGVLEMVQGIPVDVYLLKGEQEATEWWGGTAIVRESSDHQLEVYYEGEQIK